jgi:hypothetical protein
LSAVAPDDLADLLCDAWQLRAPGRLLGQYLRDKLESGKATGQSHRATRHRT